MTAVVVVPIELDVLWSGPPPAPPTLVLDALLDFGRLPRPGPHGDVHPSRAPLGEELVAAPFAHPGLRLEPGAHLHWLLPRSLTRLSHARFAASDPGASATPTIPPAPNRWLVVRRVGDRPPERVAIVESDFLGDPVGGPGGSDDTAGGRGVAFPVETTAGRVEVRRLGRVVDPDGWDGEADATTDAGGSVGPVERLDGLTALGHGDPLFAAFYPHCRSVFGYHDRQAAAEHAGTDLSYEVLGWYDDADTEPWEALVPDLDPDGDALDLVAAHLDGRTDATDRPRLVCYGRVDLPAAEQRPADPVRVTSLALGHSGPEATAAYLGDRLADPTRDVAERRIEAALLADELAHRDLDAGARFHQARHRRGFVAAPGEQRWEIRAEADATAPADATAAAGTLHADVPAALYLALGRLNGAERRLHDARAARDSAGRRLFDDWCRYLIASYPPAGSGDGVVDADRARNHLEERSLVDVQGCDDEVAAAEARRDRARDELAALLLAHDGAPAATGGPAPARRLSLAPVQAARYWQPREPAVVLGVTGASPGALLPADEPLDAVVVPVPAAGGRRAAALPGIRSAIDAVLAHDTKPAPPRDRRPATHPLLLEWAADLDPEVTSDTDLADRYFLGPSRLPGDARHTEPDLYLTDAAERAVRTTRHVGRSIISTSAGQIVARELVDKLGGLFALFEAERRSRRGPPADGATGEGPDPAEASARVRRFLSDPGGLAEFVVWEQERVARSGGHDRGGEEAWATLVDGLALVAGTPTISTVLGGFNDALLARRRTYQLPVMDPLAVDGYDDLVARVRAAVGTQTSSAPLPLDPFTPVRAGSLVLSGLRLVDRFGRATEVAQPRPVVAESMREHLSGDAYLSPRLLQPSRLDLRWLSAGHEGEPATGGGRTSPICGWVLPNELDSSLVLYDEGGRALGIIDDRGGWSVPPGLDPPGPGDRLNPHLQRVLAWLRSRSVEDLAETHARIVASLEEIDPESSRQHQALSLLMARPVAVVRAEVALELRDRPVVDPSWEAFSAEVATGTASTDGGIGHLRVPVRIGDHAQVNDATVGYWLEDAETGGFVDDRFHSAAGAHAVPPLRLVPDGAPARVTMLLDPRGAVNVQCGIVPTGTLTIPHEQYDDALRHLRVTFETSPVLMPADAVELPLPSEPGFAWTWLQRAGRGWRSTPAGEVTQPSAAPAFLTAQQLYEGWLVLEPAPPGQEPAP
ncbi:hypothetical protein [Nocardioides sp. YIM 152588]|uniref:hypothetical protein n=1 Tax=Nocardioides sp. YIM 152588 TaxID=3158259 RepID=UPI0032E3CB28